MKSLARLLLGVAVIAAGLVGSVSPAQAAPTGCNLEIGVPSDGARVLCIRGSGEVRVGITCLVLKPGDPFEVTHYGEWAPIGLYSTRACDGGPILVDAWYEAR